jgi:hypothetical protein
MMLEHATYPRRREEPLPEPFVLDLRRQISQGPRCSEERLLRLADLPAALVELADPRLDLPQFAWQADLLGKRFDFVQVTYRPFRVAFPLAQDRKGTKVDIRSRSFVFARSAKRHTSSRASRLSPPRRSASTPWWRWMLSSGFKNMPAS